jgi:hypothetical protein
MHSIMYAVSRDNKRLVAVQIATLWVAVFTLGLTHQMGVNYVLVEATAPSNPLLHATNDTVVSLLLYLFTLGVGELLLGAGSRERRGVEIRRVRPPEGARYF